VNTAVNNFVAKIGKTHNVQDNYLDLTPKKLSSALEIEVEVIDIETKALSFHAEIPQRRNSIVRKLADRLIVYYKVADLD
jgi:hypothetical protein